MFVIQSSFHGQLLSDPPLDFSLKLNCLFFFSRLTNALLSIQLKMPFSFVSLLTEPFWKLSFINVNANMVLEICTDRIVPSLYKESHSSALMFVYCETMTLRVRKAILEALKVEYETMFSIHISWQSIYSCFPCMVSSIANIITFQWYYKKELSSCHCSHVGQTYSRALLDIASATAVVVE